MKSRNTAIAIGLAKLAADKSAAAPLSTLSGAAGALGSLAGGIVHAGSSLGRGFAQAAGLPPALGALVGGAAPLVMGVAGANRVKQRVDNWRYMNGYYDPAMTGY